MSAPPRTDVHQHIWTEPVMAALAARREVPCLRRSGAAWELRLAGEPTCRVAVDDLASRAAVAAADGIDRVLVAPSCPLGIELLPTAEAEPLLAAYRDGVAELPPAFAAWGAVGLAEPDPRAVDCLLDEGFAGLCLPAGAIGSPAGLEAVGALLERLAARDAPLMVHPGAAAERVAGAAAWWPALTDYVSQMQCAWLAWTVHGRPRHPRLRVVFAMLAGLAPLHGERLRARGGPAETTDGLSFYDTSSYGPRAIAAMAGVVGRQQLVFGSDRPVVDPQRCDELDLVVANPARLLG